MTVLLASIFDDMWDYLTSDSTFNTAIGGSALSRGRLYYDQQAPPDSGPTFPYAMMSIVDEVWDDTFTTQGYDIRVQVTIWDEEDAGPKAVMEHADKLRARIHRQTFTVTGHNNMAAIVDITRGPLKEDDAFRMDADIRLRGFKS